MPVIGVIPDHRAAAVGANVLLHPRLMLRRPQQLPLIFLGIVRRGHR